MTNLNNINYINLPIITDLILLFLFLLPVRLLLLLLLTMSDCQAPLGEGHGIVRRFPVPEEPRGAPETLQEPHQQEICRELLHRPDRDGGATLWAEQQLGVSCRLLLPPLQAGQAERVLAGQDLG